MYSCNIISRVALQATATSSGKNLPGRDDHGVYIGDIFLRFRHTPGCDVHAVDQGM